MDRRWLSLEPSKVVFLSTHPHNVDRRLRLGKDWEGQNCKTTAEWLVFCSNLHPSKSWPLVVGIEPGVAYCIQRILGCTEPGRELRPVEMGGGYWKWDWNLGALITLKIPVPLGVGQGPRQPHKKNIRIHGPFKTIKRFLYESGVVYPV